jgi:hypothetical protein
MKHALCLALALLCLDVSLLSAAPQTAEFPPLPKELRDPAFLRQLTWRADGELDNVVAGWLEDSGKTLRGDSIIQRFAVIRILESDFLATYAVRNIKGDAEVVIDSDNHNNKMADCNALFTWAKGAFGQPEKAVDLSIMSSIANLEADWLFADTRVRLLCSGVWIEHKFTPAVVFLRYNHREHFAALEDPIQLECSSQISSDGDDKTVREAPPVGFIIDLNDKRLLWADNKFPVGKTVKFSDEEIVADLANGSQMLKDQIRVDRVTASFVRTVSIEGGGSGTQRWGKCVRVAPGKKF